MKKFLTKLGNYKLLQRHSNNDIPTKILKENSEVFARYFHKNTNFWIENSIFPSDLKLPMLSQLSKRNQRLQKITTDPLAFYLIYLKYMKDVFTTKYRLTLIISYLNINVDFAKDLMHNTT